MTSTAMFKDKSKLNKTSEQVKNILFEKGLLKVFNYSDYEYFKKQTKDAFNKAEAIAEMFINESCEESDFSEYIF